MVPKILPKQITSLSFVFQGNKNEFIDRIQYWNTSNVTDMSGMFFQAINFNQDISMWNTSNLESLDAMFLKMH
ncbi:BspA family leucine-rich repeat surface protein [Mycoplasma capricolum]|uniref:BspA family leucine-rich repeat surface protein n=1 Tax=Mycoplasma capricolum TaxID=2095 RepID=UPI002E7A85EA|nr:BspA family leucine-rich repeat surface protein [Mycoplasma capricolum]